MNLYESGIYDHWFDIIDERKKLYMNLNAIEDNEYDYIDLSLLRLSGTFYLLISGIGLSFLAFIQENYLIIKTKLILFYIRIIRNVKICCHYIIIKFIFIYNLFNRN
jgi:hypothetical protein